MTDTDCALSALHRACLCFEELSVRARSSTDIAS